MQTLRFILAFAEMLLSPAILLYLAAKPIAMPAIKQLAIRPQKPVMPSHDGIHLRFY